MGTTVTAGLGRTRPVMPRPGVVGAVPRAPVSVDVAGAAVGRAGTGPSRRAAVALRGAEAFAAIFEAYLGDVPVFGAGALLADGAATLTARLGSRAHANAITTNGAL